MMAAKSVKVEQKPPAPEEHDSRKMPGHLVFKEPYAKSIPVRRLLQRRKPSTSRMMQACSFKEEGHMKSGAPAFVLEFDTATVSFNQFVSVMPAGSVFAR